MTQSFETPPRSVTIRCMGGRGLTRDSRWSLFKLIASLFEDQISSFFSLSFDKRILFHPIPISFSGKSNDPSTTKYFEHARSFFLTEIIHEPRNRRKSSCRGTIYREQTLLYWAKKKKKKVSTFGVRTISKFKPNFLIQLIYYIHNHCRLWIKLKGVCDNLIQ